jgi:hypothetical protein
MGEADSSRANEPSSAGTPHKASAGSSHKAQNLTAHLGFFRNFRAAPGHHGCNGVRWGLSNRGGLATGKAEP